MTWKDEIRKSYLSVDRNEMITLSPQYQGASQTKYSREMINHALRQLGLTYEDANMNTESAGLLEIYLNRGNSYYAYNKEQRMNILRQANAPFLMERRNKE